MSNPFSNHNGGLSAPAARIVPITPDDDADLPEGTCRALLVGRTPLLWVEATAVSAISVVILFAGWIVYRVSMPHLISRLSA